MNFLKRLFNKNEEQKSVYVEDTFSEMPSLDVHALSRSQLRDRLDSCISGIFSDSGDLAERELKQLSSLREIDDRIRQLSSFLDIANQGLFLEVMDNYDKLVSGMENIEVIASHLSNSKDLAESTSASLKSLEDALSLSVLSAFHKHRRLGILKSLKDKVDRLCFTYKQTSLSIKQAIKKGELFQALSLCNDIGNKINTEDLRFVAMQNLLEKTDKRKGKIFSKMKICLRQITQDFEPRIYENVLLAYTTSTSFADVNKMIQSEFMHSVSRVVKESLQLSSKRYIESVSKLLAEIGNKELLEGIRLVLKSFSRLLYNHHLISRWHEEKDFSFTKENVKDKDTLEQILQFYADVRRDLLRNRKHLWTKMQEKLNLILLDSNGVSQLKQTELFHALRWLNIFIEIGEDFSGVIASTLKKGLASAYEAYLSHFHNVSWQNLKTILESEQWTRLPIPSNFDYQAVFLKSLHFPSAKLEKEYSFIDIALGNPFESQVPAKFEVELEKRETENTPILCTAAINLIKIASKYNQLTKLLEPFDVFAKLSHLIDYFFYSVFSRLSSQNAQTSLFEEISNEDVESAYSTFLHQRRFARMREHIYKIRDIFEIESTYDLCTLSQIIVSVQSLSNIIRTVKLARSSIQALMMEAQANFVRRYFKNYRGILRDLKKFLAEHFFSSVLKLEWVHSSVQSLKWDEVKNNYNPYVDKMLYAYRAIRDTIDLDLPIELYNDYFTVGAEFGVKTLVMAFSNVKKCNSKGREQMKSDLNGLVDGLRAIVHDVPDCHMYFEYLDVWKENSDALCKWACEHTELPLTMHKNLLQVAPKTSGMNKNARNQLIATIENHYRDILNSN